MTCNYIASNLTQMLAALPEEDIRYSPIKHHLKSMLNENSRTTLKPINAQEKKK